MRFLVFVTLFNFGRSITVDLSSSQVVHVIDSRFVGVTIDSGVIRARWETLDLLSQKVLTLATGLHPSYLRIGGSDADFLIFNMTQSTADGHRAVPGPDVQYEDRLTNFSMTPDDWVKINEFVRKVNWDLIFDLNVFLRKDGVWDPTNAKELFAFTVAKGYKPFGWELGNEAEYGNPNITGKNLSQDFQVLHDVLKSTANLGDPLIVGPDNANLGNFSLGYLESFLSSGGGELIDAATSHHYYMSSAQATVEDFYKVDVLNSLKSQLDVELSICKRKAPGKQCWLGETSSAYGGGSEGISDTYVAGFMWLDKLGLCALYGIQSVIRQSFYGGNYGLIDINMDPNPDYWLTLLYKRLVGDKVLSLPEVSNPYLRIYAHCSNYNSSAGYRKGDVTVYVMNLGSDVISINITGITVKSRHLYILSPGDDSGLTSKYVKLNGQVLMLPNDNELPPLNPIYEEGNVRLEGYNMGFIVIPGAKFKQCL